VSDLVLPPGVEVQNDPETSVAVVAAPRAVIEETPVVAEAVEGEAGAVAEPEVIGRGKEEEEGEGEEPGKKGEQAKKGEPKK
jgi:hypothetical protein